MNYTKKNVLYSPVKKSFIEMSEIRNLSVIYINRQMKPEDFNHIVLPLRSNLRDYLLRLTGNDDDAEDTVQEVMLRLWNMRSRIEAGANVSALAYTIARNLHRDRWRHQNSCRSEGEEMLQNVAVEDLRAERNDEMRLVGRIVESLPPLQQQIFRMKEIEGYESEEIMQILGCSADNLRKNLSRARLRIRDTYIRIMNGR